MHTSIYMLLPLAHTASAQSNTREGPNGEAPTRRSSSIWIWVELVEQGVSTSCTWESCG